jgi:hypothetical protein
MPTHFPEGAEVELYRLKNKPYLNYACGTIMGPLMADGRYPVRLIRPTWATDRHIKVKPENLRLMPLPSPPIRPPSAHSASEGRRPSTGEHQGATGTPVTSSLWQVVRTWIGRLTSRDGDSGPLLEVTLMDVRVVLTDCMASGAAALASSNSVTGGGGATAGVRASTNSGRHWSCSC